MSLKYWSDGLPQTEPTTVTNNGGLSYWSDGLPFDVFYEGVTPVFGTISQTIFFLSQEASATVTPTVQYTFSALNNPELLDWQEESYTSYLDCSWLTPEGAITKIWTPYIYTFVKTEVVEVTDGGVVVIDGGEPVTTSPSLLMAPFWNWRTSNSHRVTDFGELVTDGGEPVTVDEEPEYMQVYRHRPDYLNSVAKNRIRGNGRTLQLKFRSDGSNPFDLQGWGIYFVKNSKI